MTIQNKLTERKGIFYIEEADEKLAELAYGISGKLLTIYHTEVDDRLRGKNVGYNLLKEAADYAREKEMKIIPLCSFAQSVFTKKKDEFEDVLSTRGNI